MKKIIPTLFATIFCAITGLSGMRQQNLFNAQQIYATGVYSPKCIGCKVTINIQGMSKPIMSYTVSRKIDVCRLSDVQARIEQCVSKLNEEHIWKSTDDCVTDLYNLLSNFIFEKPDSFQEFFAQKPYMNQLFVFDYPFMRIKKSVKWRHNNH